MLLGLATAALLLSLGAGRPALAQDGIERLGDFAAWSAFAFTENGKKACYMASQPTKDEGDYTNRGDIFAIVTHRPAEKRQDEVSIVAGYTFEQDSAVEVAIDGKRYSFFTQGDGAWAPDADTDAELVKRMIRGARMIVKGTSSRGTKTTDTYSLKGFTKAYRTISEACGV
jgi:hypothetical protein